MKSKFSKAFDALGSDEQTRRERTERILAEYEDGAAALQGLPKSKYIAKRRGVSGRGILQAARRARCRVRHAGVFPYLFQQ